jgi:uncharacterized protein
MREIYDMEILFEREYFYKNGKLKKIEEYDEESNKNGNFVSYYENGKVKSDEHYDHGLKNNTFTNFYEDGTIKCTAVY